MRKLIAITFILLVTLLAFGQNRGGWRGSQRIVYPSNWRGMGDNSLTCNFNYSAPILVDSTNEVGRTLYGYSTRVIFNTTDSVFFQNTRSDGYDIRFRKKDRVTELDFFRQQHSQAGRYATYWVKIDTTFDSVIDTIYCYFDCPTAANASNGDSTFILFDGFDAAMDAAPFATIGDLATDSTIEVWVDTMLALDRTAQGDTIREVGNVLLEDDTFRVLYPYANVTGDDAFYRLGYAYSLDGLTWTAYSGNPVNGHFGGLEDTLAFEDPYVIRIGDTLFCYAETFRHDNPPGDDTGDSLTVSKSVDWINWTTPLQIGITSPLGSPTVYYDTTDPLTGDTIYMIDEAQSDVCRLSWSLNGSTFTRFGAGDTIFQDSDDPNCYDILSVVADFITKSGSTYILTYHGIRGQDTTSTMVATSSSIHGTFVRETCKPMDYKIQTIMWYQDASGGWRGLGVENGYPYIYSCRLKSWKPANWTDSELSIGRLGGWKSLAWSPAAAQDTLRTLPVLYTSQGELHLAGEPYQGATSNPSTVYIKTALQDTNGQALLIKKKTISYKTKPYTYVSFGTDTVGFNNSADPKEAVTRTGFKWSLDDLTSWQIYQLDAWTESALASGGGVTGEAAYLADNYTIHDMYYTQNYTSNQRRFGWGFNDTTGNPGTVNTSYDNDHRALDKLWLVSSAEVLNGSGGETIIDWIAVRKMNFPEPTVNVLAPVKVGATEVTDTLRGTTEVIDNHIRADNNLNYGAMTDTTRVVGLSSSSARRHIFAPNLQSIPAGAVVTSCSLFFKAGTVTSTPIIVASEIPLNWVEGISTTASYGAADRGSSIWSSGGFTGAPNSFTTAGEFISGISMTLDSAGWSGGGTTQAGLDSVSSLVANTWYKLDVSSAVSRMLESPPLCYGIMLRESRSTGNYYVQVPMSEASVGTGAYFVLKYYIP